MTASRPPACCGSEAARGACRQMNEDDDGGGRFTEVVLRPQVAVALPGMVEAATRLHKEAHDKCFIANSVNFPVRHEPVITAPSGTGKAARDGSR